jgi:hypothetical protein
VLRSEDGTLNGYSLELRRLLDGTVVLRIVDPGQRAGIGMPGTVVVSDMARALARSMELRIQTRTGCYAIMRERDIVRIVYTSLQATADQAWNASIADLLLALRDFGNRAA